MIDTLLFYMCECLFLELNHCENNPNTCQNGAKCVSITKDEGGYRCLCREGTSGRNCEFSEIHTVKPITVKPQALIPIHQEEISSNSSSMNEETFLNETTTEYISTTVNSEEKSQVVISDNET